MMNVAGLTYSMAERYLPASPVDTNPCKTMSYSTKSGGGGNCGRRPVYVEVCPKCGYDTALSGWLEMGREDEAVHELVANWHCMMPSVSAAIIDLMRSG
jgi:hypothetical protein